MCADNDAHYAECHSCTLKVGIVDEFAYPKNVSRRRMVRSGQSANHSIRLGELRNLSSGHKLISSKLGKRRAKVSGKSIFLENFPLSGKFNPSHVKERTILHWKNLFSKKLTVALDKFPTQRKVPLGETMCIPPILLRTILRVSMS